VTEHGHEVHIYGPPGCGKTTTIARRVEATVRARGPDKVMVASFTRAAATEIKGRGLPIPDRMVGTLHSLAYRALNAPPVHVSAIKDWNAKHSHWAIGGGGVEIEEDPNAWSEAGEGDRLLARLDIARARMHSIDAYPDSLRGFERSWTAWKNDAGVIDYTDMIALALEQVDVAPGRPEVGFLDEAQDVTPLELALFRKWGQSMDRIVLAGDDDQCLYVFRGSTVDALLDNNLAESDKLILTQSYRVPRAVVDVADRWVRNLSRRQPKAYQARDAEGRVQWSDWSFEAADNLAPLIEAAAETGTVMVIGACSYMLAPIVKVLRARGLAFHNPYRRSRRDWNPLANTSDRITSATERLVAYLIMDETAFGDTSRLWTGKDVKAWAKYVKAAGVFRRGAKSAIDGLPDRELTYAEIEELFADEDALAAAVEPSLDWFASHLTAPGQRALAYPIEVYRQRGPTGLTEEPQITVGTIHSVKGGEADTVFMAPDLSIAGQAQWNQGSEDRDSIVRQMYVAMTRAREELVICAPTNPRAAPIETMIGGRGL
jgi:DNA helicase-2/ATP-dependent DNA helicase PcrA